MASHRAELLLDGDITTMGVVRHCESVNVRKVRVTFREGGIVVLDRETLVEVTGRASNARTAP